MVYGMNIVGDIWDICNCLIFSYVFFSVVMYVVIFVYFVCWYMYYYVILNVFVMDVFLSI